MRSSAHSQRDEQPISPELLTALTNLTLSDFSIQGNPFAIAEDTALYGPPFYTSKQGRKKAYVVFNGRRMGVFQSWSSCGSQVMGYKNNKYEGFNTLEDARRAWHHSLLNGTWGQKNFKIEELPRREIHILDSEMACLYASQGVPRVNEVFVKTGLQLPRAPLATVPTPPDIQPGRSRVGHSSTSGSFLLDPPVHSLPATLDQGIGTSGGKGKGKQPNTVSLTRLRYLDSRKFFSSRSDDRHPPITQDHTNFKCRDDAWYVVVQGFYPGIYFGREVLVGLGESPVAEVRTFGDCDQAEGFLAYAFMNGLLVEYFDGSPRTIGNRLASH